MDDNLGNIITELDKYIASGKSLLEKILTSINWTIEDSLKESSCSKSIGKKESFHRNEPLLPESFGCKNSIVIDKPHLQEILNKKNVMIPEKFSDIQVNFTREKKAKLYDYVIANTAKTSEPELKVSLPNDDADDNAMTFAEIVAKAKKKDKKLQRKYRTSKPTHIEEVRNLVHLQMVALDKYFNPESKAKNPSDKDQERKYRSSRCRDNFGNFTQKSRSRPIDECRNRTTSHHQNKGSDKRKIMRSRNIDRCSPLLDRKSPSVERRKHNVDDRKCGNKDKASVNKAKKKQKESKRSKKKKKHHKHHHRHQSPSE